MLKRISIAFFVFFLCISFLKADTGSSKDTSGGFIVPFSLKSLTTALPDNIGKTHALYDSLEAFADHLGERMNGTVLIARHDTILLQKSYGYLELYKSYDGYGWLSEKELNYRRRMYANSLINNSLFELASVSKQFTAAAILKLCQEGKISLTDSLHTFFPKIPYGEVTIRQMLNHTSGLPEYFNFDYKVYDTSTFVDNAQLIRVLKREHYPLDYPSGTRFEYRNTNYAILATIVERVSGITFEDYVHDNLFEPAGMHDTYFFTELIDTTRKWPAAKKGDIYTQCAWINPNINQPVTRGHKKGGNLALYDRLNGILGDKGIYSNVEDMIRWTNSYFIHYEILSEEWVAKASTRQNTLKNGILPKQIYGYGLRIEDSPTHGLLVYHGGLWNGYQNLWLYRPKDKVQIVFLSNYYNGAHAGKSDGVLNIIDNLISHDN